MACALSQYLSGVSVRYLQAGVLQVYYTWLRAVHLAFEVHSKHHTGWDMRQSSPQAPSFSDSDDQSVVIRAREVWMIGVQLRGYFIQIQAGFSSTELHDVCANTESERASHLHEPQY